MNLDFLCIDNISLYTSKNKNIYWTLITEKNPGEA